MQAWQISLLRLLLCALLLLAVGCASHQEDTGGVYEPATIERPAVPLSEEETTADRIGEVAIVVLGVCMLVGGIVASLFATGAI
jgi:type IV pilus biogenesis protein CpaD/CtpE